MGERDLVEADAVRSFAVFAEHLNFTRAATELRISQPSLHVKIAKLAAALGVALYERDGRVLRLTVEGRRVAAFAADSRRRVDDFLADLHDTRPALTVAAGRGALRWVVADALREVLRDGRRLHVVTADRDAAMAAVLSGAADVAVVGFDAPGAGVEVCPVAAYPQVLVVAEGHPLAGRDAVAVSDVDGLDLVLPPADRPHRRALDRALLAAGAAVRVRAEADGWDLLVHFAGLGLGATVVNGCVELPAGLVAVPVEDLPTVRYWAAWRPARRDRVADLVERLAA
ncbi:LysR family transcriptional regulator [Pseudonocardia humida]|uniref:LysR family transcriptional regulator n=1 Tax=Pseudonocardia humida TaxID=2800819 RepID=A0ABT1A0S4_9PSEU|nr:LysR family transcriptional regulator [Pseudonocardia humida]MCO1656510.1 LysR family transcriptional regulator [Pseudonocardia humida]